MNSKRRADLQRKLSMGAVPRPPANLAERIKADIPKYLHAADERERMTWSMGTTLRIAASLMLLITTAFVTLKIMEPETRHAKSAAVRRPMPAVLRGTDRQMAEAPPAATEASDELRLEIFQDAAPLPSVVAPRERSEESAAGGGVVALTAAASANGAATSGADLQANVAAQSVADDAATPRRAVAAAPQIAEALPEPPPPPAAAPAPVPPPESPAASARMQPQPAITVQAAAPSLVREAYAKELDLQQKKSLFGISVDPEAFQTIRTSLESGGRPTASQVDVDALVNYFAGSPSRAPKRGVSLEVEASPAPVPADGDRAVLRFTIDTPRVEVPHRGSVPPAAQNVRVEIDVDANAVESFRRIGGNEALIAESTLLHNASVTALYALELKPRLKSSQHVATVRLRYRSLTDGREQTITRVIHGHDVAKEWARATRRHRLASLGAVWSESLKGTPADIDLARRAEELAKQNPNDQRARELANAASAWSGGER